MATRCDVPYSAPVVVVVLGNHVRAGSGQPRPFASINGPVVNQGNSCYTGQRALVEARLEDVDR